MSMGSSDLAYQINYLQTKGWIELNTWYENGMTGYKKVEIIEETERAYLIRRKKKIDWFPKSQTEIVAGRIFISPWIKDQIDAKRMQKRHNKNRQPIKINTKG